MKMRKGMDKESILPKRRFLKVIIQKIKRQQVSRETLMVYSSEDMKMECAAGKESSNGTMGKYSKESGGTGSRMGLENGKPLRVTITKVNGSIIVKMGKEYSSMR